MEGFDDLLKPYNHSLVEDKIYKRWEKSGFFDPDRLLKRFKNKDLRFTVLLPPPNITGSLHMGHALNAAISDILIRYQRMKGKKTVWLPGTDHAGIATQNVVEKELKKEGKTRFDLGREALIERIWNWREKYGNLILEQLKRLGASLDWSRIRFTMDKNYAEKVKETFIHYYKKGWIYRGERVINRCPRCASSLSDLEIKYKEEKGKLYYIRYPLIGKSQIANRKSQNKKNDKQLAISDKQFIVVATTRPETMLGDTAVAVNPKDERYKNLIGAKLILPIVNREIPVIADNSVDPEFGTGAVKVTPAHSIVDFEIGQRHNLEIRKVINESGLMTKEAGTQFENLKAKEAREKIIENLSQSGLMEKTEDYVYNLSLCDRCSTPLEPLPSLQWFLKMDELAKAAELAVKSKKVKIVPKNFEKIYFNWLKNIRDWCISRQIWWGHQLPVWQCNCQTGSNLKFKILNFKLIHREFEKSFIVSVKKPKRKCVVCNSDYRQIPDVLDTWFSSALWPFAGLKAKDVKEFYPSDVLFTARDIINLWVARMIFSGSEFFKKEPFKTVFIHPTVLTKTGQRMSKSLGTGIDPSLLASTYGADALRFGIVWQMMGVQDIHWQEEAVVAGKKFCNKIWNASRFVLAQIEPKQSGKFEIRNLKFEINLKFKIPNSKKLTPADRKILAELKKTKKQIEKDLENFRFGQALHQVYDFFWHELCDKYIEAAKPQLTTYNLQPTTQKVLFYVLFESLKMLHPFMPFITEEIYSYLPIKDKKLLMIEKW